MANAAYPLMQSIAAATPAARVPSVEVAIRVCGGTLSIAGAESPVQQGIFVCEEEPHA